MLLTDPGVLSGHTRFCPSLDCSWNEFPVSQQLKTASVAPPRSLWEELQACPHVSSPCCSMLQGELWRQLQSLNKLDAGWWRLPDSDLLLLMQLVLLLSVPEGGRLAIKRSHHIQELQSQQRTRLIWRGPASPGVVRRRDCAAEPGSWQSLENGRSQKGTV